MNRRRSRDAELLCLYLDAKEHVIESGFAYEIDWVADLDFSTVSESDFLREAAWVVLSSGFRDQVVRVKFASISRSFKYWESASAINRRRSECINQALKCFGHDGKVHAIADICQRVETTTFESIRAMTESELLEFIGELPFMGPTTSLHLARNLGLDVVKPDRHLLRLAERLGYEHPTTLCEDISLLSADAVAVVDAVLWRHSELLSSASRQERD